jgi:hypothetical protein
MRATVNHVHGDVDFWHVSGLYRATPNVTVGLGYRSYHVYLNSMKSGDTGLFDIKTAGPALTATVGF